ncbi:MAG: acetyltransferase [Tissierellia bacterium]|nr:acetyltransferase [Tissierellia bacterium]
MNKKLLLIGGGGHCKSVLDSILPSNEYSEIGIIDKNENNGGSILGIPIIGCDDDLSKLYHDGYHSAFVTVGSIAKPSLRIKLYKMLETIGFEIPNIIDLTAIVSNQVKMERGIFIGKNVVVNVGTSIKDGSIINTASTIEHDCIINQFCHIAPGSVLCGEVEVGENTHVGAGSIIRQQIKIGSNTIIGMGSVVLKDIKGNVVAYGNPCKEVKSL